MESIWTDNDAPSVSHFVVSFLFAFAFVAARFLLDRFVFRTIYQEPWFIDVKAYFTGWPDQELKVPVKLVYMCECGFYTYSIAALVMWETRRKDFSVMMSHHVITVFLIAFSYMTRFFRVGTVILALHDASDVFLEAAKIFKYSGNELGASVCFGFFAVSWVILRLIFFPFWVIRSTSYWWILICSMIRRQLKNRGQVGEDIRSDSEDDD
ncbi:Ceramide synthase loh2 [Orobanche gracilis]